ncbi:MAG: FtsQ-type POTRA domain-containing protein [Peptococcaceae bacterium]|jgi:cell division protein FtsQ|nr:FtsQ-type POTRA domain-containing protein [Peptococcaceae bacterium]MBQ2370022.1 FtsQ-type POTRA domain-containing protein [Peptococcaceae bacterium]MBQ2432373.1 FtsQ-type POTRA domain-containing protein [Peptococcaceae bacterium]MBQ5706926.1 FtsQ-type POTRA domain-containing protein [Peptococcaceae bacterium]
MEKNKIIVLDDYRTSVQESKDDSNQSQSDSNELPLSDGQASDGRVVRKRKLRVKRIKTIAGIVSFCALLFGISWLPVFQVQQIVVAGNDALSTEKVISISGLQVGDNLFWCDTGEAKKQLRHNPFVKKVSIRRDLPDTLIVQVTERPSVGYIVTSDGYVQVDAEGRMLAIQQSLSNYRLPVISGVGLNELPELGGIIQNKKLRQALDILQSCDVTLLDNIAELNVGQEYYILLYTNQQLEVRLGGLENMEQRLKDLDKILTEVVGTKIASDRILYIDMRYENSSAIIKLRD